MRPVVQAVPMTHTTRRIACCLVLLAAAGGHVTSQSARTLSVESIYDPESRVDFSGPIPPDVTWFEGDSYLMPRRAGRGTTTDTAAACRHDT